MKVIFFSTSTAVKAKWHDRIHSIFFIGLGNAGRGKLGSYLQHSKSKVAAGMKVNVTPATCAAVNAEYMTKQNFINTFYRVGNVDRR